MQLYKFCLFLKESIGSRQLTMMGRFLSMIAFLQETWVQVLRSSSETVPTSSEGQLPNGNSNACPATGGECWLWPLHHSSSITLTSGWSLWAYLHPGWHTTTSGGIFRAEAAVCFSTDFRSSKQKQYQASIYMITGRGSNSPVIYAVINELALGLFVL